MRHFLCAGLILCSTAAVAGSAAEEALILNQELQFLEDSITSINAAPARAAVTAAPESAAGPADETSALERTYFSGDERDEVRLRTAAPKRDAHRRRGF
jgi:hypothetical protein